MAGQQLQ
jgi:hypothetical protein